MGALRDLRAVPFNRLRSKFALERLSTTLPCVTVGKQSRTPVETTPVQKVRVCMGEGIATYSSQIIVKIGLSEYTVPRLSNKSDATSAELIMTTFLPKTLSRRRFEPVVETKFNYTQITRRDMMLTVFLTPLFVGHPRVLFGSIKQVPKNRKPRRSRGMRKARSEPAKAEK